MGGQPKSEASSLSSAEVRRLWEEATETIPQNQREAAGILFLLGRGGCQRKVVFQNLIEQLSDISWRTLSG
jgi:hypothetical protein